MSVEYVLSSFSLFVLFCFVFLLLWFIKVQHIKKVLIVNFSEQYRRSQAERLSAIFSDGSVACNCMQSDHIKLPFKHSSLVFCSHMSSSITRSHSLLSFFIPGPSFKCATPLGILKCQQPAKTPGEDEMNFPILNFATISAFDNCQAQMKIIQESKFSSMLNLTVKC